MPANAEGEFELLLGNRQILIVSFILVALLFVFFAMGYIVGRTVDILPGEYTSSNSTARTTIAHVAEPSVGAPVPEATVASQPPVEALDRQSLAPQTVPAAKHTELPASRPDASQVDTSPASPPFMVGDPPPGTYLQVSAIRKRDAQHLAASLTKKGFPALLAPVPGRNLVRVLVGPLPRSTQLIMMREDLLALGLEPFRREY